MFAGNIAGVIFGLFYVLSAYGCSQAKIRKRIEIITFPLLTLVCFAGFAVTLLPPQNGVEILGYLGNGIVFVVFSSPLSTAVKVISTRNSASINRPFGIIQVFNCFIWCTYALFIHDVYLLVPNVFGLALGIAQVFLMILYPAVKSESALLDDQEQPLDT